MVLSFKDGDRCEEDAGRLLAMLHPRLESLSEGCRRL